MKELALHPEWQAKMRAELRANKIGFQDGVPAYRDISSLTTLHGFVMESMRLHPAQSIGLPRVAGTDGMSVGGFAVPAGVRSLPFANSPFPPPLYPQSPPPTPSALTPPTNRQPSPSNPATSTATPPSTPPPMPSTPAAGSPQTAAPKR